MTTSATPDGTSSTAAMSGTAESDATNDESSHSVADTGGGSVGSSGSANSRVTATSSRRLGARKGPRRDGVLPPGSGKGRLGTDRKGAGASTEGGAGLRGRRIPRVDVGAAHVRKYVSYLIALHRAVAAKAGVSERRVFYR